MPCVNCFQNRHSEPRFFFFPFPVSRIAIAALRLQPGDTNGIVIQTAKEQAKEYLRKQENFVWNATNLTYLQRKQIIDLCETYHTRVQIHYLETTANEQIKRNHKRPNVVPQSTIDEMIGKLQLPEYFEAYYVSWNVV